MPDGLRIEAAVIEAIRGAARAAYPHEGCGALVGRQGGLVVQSIELPNRETDRPRVRFTVSPGDYIAVEEEADRRGLALLGFWHSHPDHPARPSETDRRYAWPELITVVINVASGQPGEITAWQVADHDAPFEQVELIVAEPEAFDRGEGDSS